MNQRLTNLLRFTFVILDLVVLNLVFIICQYVFSDNIQVNKIHYTYLWFYSNVAWVFASWATGIYHDKYIYSFEKFSRQTMSAYAYLLVLEMLYFFFNKDASISRLFMLSILSSFAISLLINRFLHLAMHHFFKAKITLLEK